MTDLLVEYVVINGPSELSSTPQLPSESSAEFQTTVDIKPKVFQRFPVEDRDGLSLPAGIEHFCRSEGWYLTSSPPNPSFNNFILTSEIGSRLYCSSLNFHQPSRKMCARLKQKEDTGSLRRNIRDSGLFSDKRRKAFKKKEEDEMTGAMSTHNAINMSAINISIDEENEPHHYMLGSFVIDTEELYEPLSLCLVSKYPVYDTLQAVLKSVYIQFIQNSNNLDSLLAELLVDVRFPLPDRPPIKRSFGSLKEMTLASINIMKMLPYTSDNSFKLLKAVGVHGLLQIFSLLLVDGKLLFISSSVTAITSAIIGATALMYPLGIDHYSFLLLPHGFAEYLHLITPFMMGLHRSLLVELDEEPQDVSVIDLDSGEIKPAETIEIPIIPSDLMVSVKNALIKIMDPSWEHRDNLFTPIIKPRNVYYQDKAVRAVFMNIFLYLLGSYQRHLTVVRFHPEPKFHFNKDNFISRFSVGDDGDAWKTFLTLVSDTIGFITFTRSERVIPYRMIDLFDELVHDYTLQNSQVTIQSLFSETSIQSLTDRLVKLMPPSVQYGGMYSQSLEDLATSGRLLQRRFPTIDEEDIKMYCNNLEFKWKEIDSSTSADGMSNVPITEHESSVKYTTATKSLSRRYNSSLKDSDLLLKFLDALFASRILEARKYFPSVTMSLRQHSTTDIFVPELVNKLLKNGPYLSAEQFEVLVRVVNCAIVDEKIAMQILPLTSVFYQEIQPGVNQYLFACIQSHSLWQNTRFWCLSLYNAIQAELVRLYAETPSKQRTIDEEDEYTDAGMEPDYDDDMMIGEVTMRHRQRVRSVSPSRTRSTARSVVLSKSARMRIRACTTIPGASEGVLPPDSKPVTSYEALHHLAKRLQHWPGLSEEVKESFALQEENAIRNQIILFISRLINIRTPIDFIGGQSEMKAFSKELLEFIDRFLSEVDSDIHLTYKKQSSVMEQVDSLIEVHMNSLQRLRSVLKKSPMAKSRIAPLPVLSGEQMILEGIHTFLLRDGRDSGRLVPADGHVYLTSYRVVFLGAPWDPEVDPNVLVTRSMPISSIYRIKELSHIPSGLTDGYLTLQGLQLRSITGELIRLGFDEDFSLSDVKKLLNKLQELRYPTSMTVGIRDQSLFQVVPDPGPLEYKDQSRQKGRGRASLGDLELSTQLNRSGVVPTQIKLISDLSQSPYCKEYDRLGLGSLNFNVSKNRGQWRLSTINKSFTVCESYPAVWVVPEKFSDESIARISPHFTTGRVPVVTWKHPRTKAILLRSSSFVTPVVQQKRKLVSYPGSNKSENPSDEQMGIQSADIEGLVSVIVSACPKVIEGAGEETVYWSGSFSREVSMPPTSLRFIPEEGFSQGGLGQQVAGATRVSSSSVASAYLSVDLGGGGAAEEKDDSERERKGGRESNYHHSFYASTDELFDWETNPNAPLNSYSNSLENQPLTLSSTIHSQQQSSEPLSLMPLTSIPALYRSNSLIDDEEERGYLPRVTSPVDVPDVGFDEVPSTDDPLSSITSHDVIMSRTSSVTNNSSKRSKRKSAHVHFASIPTNPRDWVVMDALQEEIKQWRTLGLYIIGEKGPLSNTSPNVYPNCTLLPVEISQSSDINASFTKLMRACAPSGATSSTTNQTKFYSLLEDSEWINQLSSLLQLSGAVADLMDAQGSSVLVGLEEGWDATSQVVSLAQLLIDPHYRTLKGFQSLIEKDWLAFGHQFTERGCHVKGSGNNGQVAPVFLQFIDCVHQIRRQFPLSFEFNDFFLRTLAYHSVSNRFHTFTMNSEKERCALNWLSYRPRPSLAYGDSSNAEPYASFWEYIDQLCDHSTMFYNFLYQPPKEDEEVEMLRPHSYQANLDVWSFYTEDLISRFPPYDVELIAEGGLTYSDLHHDVFAWDNSVTELGVPIDPPPEVANEITHLLKQYTGLWNTAAQNDNTLMITWRDIWEGLLQEQAEEMDAMPADHMPSLHVSLQRPEDSLAIPERTLDHTARLQNQARHKTTSLAVLVKGKLSMELEDRYSEPHSFVSFKVGSTQYECSYCHHIVRDKEGFKCKNCSCVCHVYCKRHMPSNCGKLSLIGGGRMPPVTVAEVHPRSRSNTAGSSKEKRRGRHRETDNELEGFLFKKGGVVKNWKERYFVLNLSKKHLAYYESDKRGAKLCGKIGLNLILKVEECDPLVVPVTILKTGQVGYFFKLTTQRRVFTLMTYRASIRSDWITRILESCKQAS